MSKRGKAGRKTGKLVKQPHGGAILDGAPPPENHVPGPGRPPSRVKAALREDFDARRGLLNDIADGVVPLFRERCPECGHEPDITSKEALGQLATPKERVQALKVMAEFSDLRGGDAIDSALMRELAEAVAAQVDDETTLQAIEEAWVEILARRIG